MFSAGVTWTRLPDGRLAGLRELRGLDEAAVDAADTRNAIRLVDGLLAGDFQGTLRPGEAARLSASDRDALLAAIYTRRFGQRIENQRRCPSCGGVSEFEFDLAAYADQCRRTFDSDAVPQTDGTFALPDGSRFRLPIGDDELAVAGMPGEQAVAALFERCVTAGAQFADRTAIETAMEAVAGLMDVPLQAQCPACGKTEWINFDIQAYLLASLLGRRESLIRDIHLLATAYGWSLADILALPSIQRERLAAKIDEERLAIGGRR